MKKTVSAEFLKISQIRNNVIDITVFAFDVRGHLAYIEQIVLQRIFDIGADIFRTINHKQHAWPLPFCRKPQFISNDFDTFRRNLSNAKTGQRFAQSFNNFLSTG